MLDNSMTIQVFVNNCWVMLIEKKNIF